MKPAEAVNSLDCVNALKNEGYDKDFQYQTEGLCSLEDVAKFYSPSQVKIIEHFRFEGASDPDDMSVIYAIETNDGKKGTIMTAFGTYADTGLSDFISKVREVPDQANSH